MKTLVIYDSNFGNTKKIADHIAGQLGKNAASVSVNDFKKENLQEIKLLIVGSPINAWSPTKKIKLFLSQLESTGLKGIKAAAFDTRVRSFISGNAAKKIARGLEKAGAEIIAVPMGFYVNGNEGPLADGEIKKAEQWAESIRLK